MSTRLLVLIPTLLMIGVPCSWGQDVTITEEPGQVADPIQLLEEHAKDRFTKLESEFHEVLIDRAVGDVNDPVTQRSVQIARSLEIVSKRFDAEVFTIFRNATRSETPDSDAVKRGLEILHLSTLSTDDKARLLLDCYLGVHEKTPADRILRSLRNSMRYFHDPIQRMLSQRMLNEPVTSGMIQLIDTSSIHAERALPVLLEACKSQDDATAALAINQTHAIVSQMKRRMGASTNNPMIAQPVAMPSAITPVVRNNLDQNALFFQRADRNSDGVLSGDEAPGPVLQLLDTDNNGAISQSEFTEFQNSRRQQPRAVRPAGIEQR